jgi:hypothetical protein
MFTAYPTYSPYRTLKLMSPYMQGEDVYALQTALHELKLLPSLDECDGLLGPKTAAAIKSAQSMINTALEPVLADGAAGGVTQIALVKKISSDHRGKYRLPSGLPFGQCMHESSCRVGNYSPPHGDTYDAGVAQRNTQFTETEQAFNVPLSIDALGNNIRRYYDKFQGVRKDWRRWELATGAWNAPAFACWIANEEGASVPRRETARPSSEARRTLEEYMVSATAYLSL